ncbi:MAG: hypothetical protein Q7T01_04625 [bacterium]|nr:hypothetical protein [bacterium]
MGDLLTKLGIDWRLLIAQLVNFLVLFFLLKKLLYKPVLGMLEQRRATIAQGIARAREAEARVADLAQEGIQLRAAVTAERVAVMTRAAAEAEALRGERVAAAEAEARTIVTNAQEDAERMHAALMVTVRREVGDLVLAVSKKVTADALTRDEHDRLVAAAMEELRHAKL